MFLLSTNSLRRARLMQTVTHMHTFALSHTYTHTHISQTRPPPLTEIFVCGTYLLDSVLGLH